MRRFRVRLGYPRGRIKTETVLAARARVDEGALLLIDGDGNIVAIYRPGYWTIVKAVGDRG